jgi:hypothetical protein
MSKNYGYHKRLIAKGILGELSKIREELEEAEDAQEQGIVIMELAELADLYGALKARAEALGFSIKDLAEMNEATERAFRTGRRK